MHNQLLKAMAALETYTPPLAVKVDGYSPGQVWMTPLTIPSFIESDAGQIRSRIVNESEQGQALLDGIESIWCQTKKLWGTAFHAATFVIPMGDVFVLILPESQLDNAEFIYWLKYVAKANGCFR